MIFEDMSQTSFAESSEPTNSSEFSHNVSLKGNVASGICSLGERGSSSHEMLSRKNTLNEIRKLIKDQYTAVSAEKSNATAAMRGMHVIEQFDEVSLSKFTALPGIPRPSDVYFRTESRLIKDEIATNGSEEDNTTNRLLSPTLENDHEHENHGNESEHVRSTIRSSVDLTIEASRHSSIDADSAADDLVFFSKFSKRDNDFNFDFSYKKNKNYRLPVISSTSLTCIQDDDTTSSNTSTSTLCDVNDSDKRKKSYQSSKRSQFSFPQQKNSLASFKKSANSKSSHSM